jgi:uncharacterized damage-inducible protein DinB
MEIRQIATRMAAYNQWMNEKIYACAAELTDEERKRDMGAAFRSIHITLNHLLLADQAWMQRFRGETVTLKALDQELYSDFEELRAARAALDREIAAWAEGLTEEVAASTFRFYSVAYQKEWAVSMWVLVAHVFNHQTHHRGQITTLLFQLGKDPGVTDLPWMPEPEVEP